MTAPSDVVKRIDRDGGVPVILGAISWIGGGFLLLEESPFCSLLCCSLPVLLYLSVLSELRNEERKEVAFRKENTKPCLTCDEVFFSANGHPFCNSCSDREKKFQDIQKRELFKRAQPQYYERKISDREKQKCWLSTTRVGYKVICTPGKSTLDSCPYNSWLGEKGTELDFYRVVVPEPAVELRCRKCAESDSLIESEIMVEKTRSRRISQSVKDEVYRRDQGKCVECGSRESIEYDHIIPYSKGGSNTARNIQILCETCNRRKSDRIG